MLSCLRATPARDKWNDTDAPNEAGIVLVDRSDDSRRRQKYPGTAKDGDWLLPVRGPNAQHLFGMVAAASAPCGAGLPFRRTGCADWTPAARRRFVPARLHSLLRRVDVTESSAEAAWLDETSVTSLAS